MKFPAPVSLSWLATFLGAELIGDPNALALGINEIHVVETGDLVFVDHPKYYKPVLESAATYVIIDKVVTSTGLRSMSWSFRSSNCKKQAFFPVIRSFLSRLSGIVFALQSRPMNISP